MTARTLGVDLASADATTAACIVVWGDGPPSIEELRDRDVSDEVIVEMATRVDVTGVDAPFGWPRRFAQAIAAYAAGAPWPRQRPEGLWLRLTDQRAQQIAGGRAPLSVSSDRIARPAERAARLLTLLGRGEVAAARDGSDGVIEVYPAGALRCWGIPIKGYKRPDGAVARDQIVTAIETALLLDLPAAIRATLVATDHAIDALAAALVARAFQRDRVIRPSSEDERAAAVVEGWLFLPAGRLAALR